MGRRLQVKLLPCKGQRESQELLVILYYSTPLDLSIRALFQLLKRWKKQNGPGSYFTMKISYLEIYNEVVNDLLNDKNKNMDVQVDTKGN